MSTITCSIWGMVSTPSGFDVSGRWPAVRGTVGGGAEYVNEPAGAPERFESEVHAANARDAAEPIKKLRRDSGMATF